MTVRGVLKRPTDIQRRFGYWVRVGADCGVCMACRPYSHRNNRFHHTVRCFIRHVPWVR